MATATEYNSDATKLVDRTTDTGLEGGLGGGMAAGIGILEDSVGSAGSYIGRPSECVSIFTVLCWCVWCCSAMQCECLDA